MEQYELKEMLTHVADGSVSVEEAVRRLKRAPFEEIGIASLDAHRGIRQGASEIIYGAGKPRHRSSRSRRPCEAADSRRSLSRVWMRRRLRQYGKHWRQTCRSLILRKDASV